MEPSSDKRNIGARKTVERASTRIAKAPPGTGQTASSDAAALGSKHANALNKPRRQPVPSNTADTLSPSGDFLGKNSPGIPEIPVSKIATKSKRTVTARSMSTRRTS
jgi:hypothetical protein